jgi:phage terminase large subunit GpA-like protein
MLGVDSGKTTTMQRLKMKQPGPKYCHFPVQDERGYDQVYFKGLISEKQVVRKEKGQVVTVWVNIAKDKRNEPLDLRVYALAALRLLKPDFDSLERKLKQDQFGQKAQIADAQPQRRRRMFSRGVSI